MAWIRSEQSLERHPKTLLLKTILDVELETVIGRLHRLWWWCLDYAIDGDLTKHTPEVIQESCNIPLEALIEARFVDSEPYLRIHDWWDNQGNFLKIKFRDHPVKWREIQTHYQTHAEHMGKTVDVRTLTYGRTEKRDVEDVEGDSKSFASQVQPETATPAPRPLKDLENPIPDDLEKDVHFESMKVKGQIYGCKK